MAKKIQHEASDKFMTLDEIAAFVQDARRAGATGSEIVSATVSFGQKLKDVTVSVDTTATRLDKTTDA